MPPVAPDMISISTVSAWLEVIYYVVYLFGIPFAIYLFFKNEAKKRKNEDERIMLEINNEYIDFLNLAIQHPRLNAAEYELEGQPPILNEEEKLQQKILFSILNSMLERAYLLSFRTGEWETWERYIERYTRKSEYRAFWAITGTAKDFVGEYDKDFEKYVRGKLAAAKGK